MVKQKLLETLGAEDMEKILHIQDLWSGYGTLDRYQITKTKSEGGRQWSTLIVKDIRLSKTSHPRGWSTPLAHQRKLHSYQVELSWYRNFSRKLPRMIRVPKLLYQMETETGFLLVLEDLDANGYPKRLNSVGLESALVVIRFLARFHAFHMSVDLEGLWSQGTYWHLDTRPEEWQTMAPGVLKKYAGRIDQVLKACRFPTILHGDAKLANFCFSQDENQVAAVDFQYTGGGPGVKDLAYFVSSAFSESESLKYHDSILREYFQTLREHLPKDLDGDAVEKEGRELYPYAWADFYRFLEGWAPGHWKINGYSGQQTKLAIQDLENR